MKSKAIRKKKPYSSPRLVAYGDFRTLTRGKGGTSGDGQGKPNTKTTGQPS
jgi:hypothetical protein